VQSHYAREQVREEPRCVPEEGSLALQATQLLEESQRQHLRVREALERAIGIRAAGVEEVIGIIDETEQHGKSLFQVSCRWGSVWVGHPRYLSSGIRMAFVLQANLATDI
jgi:hypothetical protein